MEKIESLHKKNSIKHYYYYIEDNLISEGWEYDKNGLYVPYNNIYLRIYRIESARNKIELLFQLVYI